MQISSSSPADLPQTPQIQPSSSKPKGSQITPIANILNTSVSTDLIPALTRPVSKDMDTTVSYRIDRFLTPRMKSRTEPCIPTDSATQINQLDNGLTYYIRDTKIHNPGKVSIQLVVRAGELYQNPDQKQAAYFVQHLAFITKNYPDGEIERYLSSKGSIFGVHTNAFTSPDGVVYHFDLTVDCPETLDKVLHITSEIASKATFDPANVERERAVIIDELRLRYKNVTNKYTREQLYPVLLKGTPHLNLLDIEAQIESVKKLTPEQLHAFYTRWYAPNNMAVVVAGDLKGLDVETSIKRHFNDLVRSPEPMQEIIGRPEKLGGTKYLCFTDPEVRLNQAAFYFRLPPYQMNGVVTLNSLRRLTCDTFFEHLIKARLEHTKRQPNSALIAASANSSETYVRDFFCFKLAGSMQDGRLHEGIQQLLVTLRQVKEQGFLPQELEEAKQNIIREIEQVQDQIKTQEQLGYWTDTCVSHFIENTGIPDSQARWAAQKEMVRQMTLKELNGWLPKLIDGNELVVSVITPENKEGPSVTPESVKETVDAVSTMKIAPYEPQKPLAPLMSEIPTPGKITSIKTFEKLPLIEMMLENGMRVCLVPTTVTDNSIRLHAIAPVGEQQVDLNDYVSAQLVNTFYEHCGLGELNLSDATRFFNEKGLAFNVTINPYHTTMSTIFTEAEAESAFQVINSALQKPGYDQEAFDFTKKLVETALLHQSRTPQKAVKDTLTSLVTQNHPRYRPLKFEDLNQFTYDSVVRVHETLTTNPANYTVVITGKLQNLDLIKLITTYLASVPKRGEKAVFKHDPIPFPKGISTAEVAVSEGKNSTLHLTFPAPIEEARSAKRWASMSCSFLQTRLREVLRTQMGATYSPVCQFEATSIPGLNPGRPSKINISISSAPELLERVKEVAFREIRRLQTEGPQEEEVRNFVTETINLYQQYLRTNIGWESIVADTYHFEEDPMTILEQTDQIRAFDAKKVQEQLQKLFQFENYVQVTAVPKAV